MKCLYAVTHLSQRPKAPVATMMSAHCAEPAIASLSRDADLTGSQLGGLYRPCAQTSSRRDVLGSCEQFKTSHKLKLGKAQSFAGTRNCQTCGTADRTLILGNSTRAMYGKASNGSPGTIRALEPQVTRLNDRFSLCSAGLNLTRNATTRLGR